MLFDGLVCAILEETRPQLGDPSAGKGALLLGLLAEELSAAGQLPYLNTAVSLTPLYTSLREEILLLKRVGIEARDFTELAAEGSVAPGTRLIVQSLPAIYGRTSFGRC